MDERGGWGEDEGGAGDKVDVFSLYISCGLIILLPKPGADFTNLSCDAFYLK